MKTKVILSFIIVSLSFAPSVFAEDDVAVMNEWKERRAELRSEWEDQLEERKVNWKQKKKEMHLERKAKVKKVVKNGKSVVKSVKKPSKPNAKRFTKPVKSAPKNVKRNANQPLRLQVYLSRNGICSRREAMDMVLSGQIKVNGQVITEPSHAVDPTRDTVRVEGKTVKAKSLLYILLNKPTGYTTTKSDRFATKTVYDLLPKKFVTLSPVGRLDKETEGLLLFTNDGDLAYTMTHPKFDVDKVYFVRVRGRLQKETELKLEKGIYLQGRKTAPAKIYSLKHNKEYTDLKIKIHEGRKRQIRIMFAKMDHKVLFLQRLQQGPIRLSGMAKGQWRPLTSTENKALRSLA